MPRRCLPPFRNFASLTNTDAAGPTVYAAAVIFFLAVTFLVAYLPERVPTMSIPLLFRDADRTYLVNAAAHLRTCSTPWQASHRVMRFESESSPQWLRFLR